MVIEYIFIVTIFQQMAVTDVEEGLLFVSYLQSMGPQPTGLGWAPEEDNQVTDGQIEK